MTPQHYNRVFIKINVHAIAHMKILTTSSPIARNNQDRGPVIKAKTKGEMTSLTDSLGGPETQLRGARTPYLPSGFVTVCTTS